MIHLLCEQLARALGDAISAVPDTVFEQTPMFEDLLERAAAQRPVVLLIDGLETFERRERAR